MNGIPRDYMWISVEIYPHNPVHGIPHDYMWISVEIYPHNPMHGIPRVSVQTYVELCGPIYLKTS